MASPDLTAWTVAAQTDTGRVRPHNEDRCGTFENAVGARLFVVADGMGGHRGGATASQLTVDALGHSLADASEVSGEWLAEAIVRANRAVYDESVRDANLRGMGTTVVAVLVAPDGEAWVAHVGDSRAYRLRSGTFEALTDDHSVVAEMIRRGVLTPEEASVHPRRNEILRSVGVEEDVEAEVQPLELQAGDRLLLCSDGLCGVVPDPQIASVLGEHAPEPGVTNLIQAANECGGPDNITAVVAEVPSGDPAQPSTGSTVALAVVVALVVVIGAFAVQLWN